MGCCEWRSEVPRQRFIARAFAGKSAHVRAPGNKRASEIPEECVHLCEHILDYLRKSFDSYGVPCLWQVAPSTTALVRYHAQKAAAQHAELATKRQPNVLSVSRPLGYVPCTRATTVPALPLSLKQARQQQTEAALVHGVPARSLLLAEVASPSGPRAATTQRPPRARISRATHAGDAACAARATHAGHAAPAKPDLAAGPSAGHGATATAGAAPPVKQYAPPPPSADPFAPDWVAPQRPGAAAAAARAPRAAAALRRARAEWSGQLPQQALAPPTLRIGAAGAAGARGVGVGVGGVGIAVIRDSGQNAGGSASSGHGGSRGLRLSGGFGSLSPRLLRPAQRVRTIQQRQVPLSSSGVSFPSFRLAYSSHKRSSKPDFFEKVFFVILAPWTSCNSRVSSIPFPTCRRTSSTS